MKRDAEVTTVGTAEAAKERKVKKMKLNDGAAVAAGQSVQVNKSNKAV